jgi:hypothetical protein
MTDPDDRKDQLCTECGVGRYRENSIHDDWDGVLHCTNKECNHEVKRYRSDDNSPPKLEKVRLSPAAQAVLDAFEEGWTYYDDIRPANIAAALRAAADQVCPSDAMEPRNYLPMAIENNRIRCEILAIAAELEGHEAPI